MRVSAGTTGWCWAPLLAEPPRVRKAPVRNKSERALTWWRLLSGHYVEFGVCSHFGVNANRNRMGTKCLDRVADLDATLINIGTGTLCLLYTSDAADDLTR